MKKWDVQQFSIFNQNSCLRPFFFCLSFPTFGIKTLLKAIASFSQLLQWSAACSLECPVFQTISGVTVPPEPLSAEQVRLEFQLSPRLRYKSILSSTAGFAGSVGLTSAPPALVYCSFCI